MSKQNHSPRHLLLACLLAPALIALPLAASGALTELSDTPLSSASSMEIKPNILFIMDDSYSMDWTYLPDWAGDITYQTVTTPASANPDGAGRSKRVWVPSSFQSYNAGFNGVAYDPKITYQPPSYFDDTEKPDTSRYPSQTRAATKDWTEVPYDGYGIQRTGKNNLVDNAFYFETVPGEFCKDDTLRDCSDTKTDTYKVPATLRWCQTFTDAAKANTVSPKPNCQAVFIDQSGASGGGSLTYMYPRMPSPLSAILTVGASYFQYTTVKAIKVKINGELKNILAHDVPPQTSRAAMAIAIANEIQACQMSKVGNCEVAGFQANVGISTAATPAYPNNYQINVTAPNKPDEKMSVFEVTSTSSKMTLSALDFVAPVYYFDSYSATTANNFKSGYVKFIPITDPASSYPKASSRTDCAAETNCTYDEEMTNYANWHAYYRTRMQAMKTAASRSFEPINDNYRIGYYSINNNTGADFQNIADFGNTSKKAWYDKIFAATPFRTDGRTANTPLRKALSQAGWLYAGKYNGGSLNGVGVVDPLQYYCQPNVTILSTDGYWNEDAGFKLDEQLVGDQDGPASGEPRPILDNGAGERKQFTEQWTKTITPGPTWLRKQEVELQVQRYGFTKTVKGQPQFQTGTLTSQNLEWKPTTYHLQASTYRNWYYNTTATNIVYKVRTRQLQQRDYFYKKQTLQLQQRTNSQVTFQEGDLYRVPRQWYTKAMRKLFVNTKQVSKSVVQGAGWSTPVPLPVGEVCTPQPGAIICTYNDSTTWAEVPSGGVCTNAGRGEIASGNAGGDGGDKSSYETKTTCAYRYSETEEAVPSNAIEEVADCQSQGGGSGPSYGVLREVVCTPKTPPESASTKVGNCTEDSVYTCDYIYGTEKKWEGPGECVPDISSSYSSPTARQCNLNRYTDWTDVNSCNEGVVDGVTTECRDQPIVVTGKTDANGWETDGKCQSSGRDGSGQTVNCSLVEKTPTGWHNVTTGNCTINLNTPGLAERTDCQWGAWSDYTQLAAGAQCPDSTSSLTDGGTGYNTECVVETADFQTCDNIPNNGIPDCNHEGWGGYVNVDACDNTGVDRAHPNIGDVQCRYAIIDPNATYTSTTCTPTDPTAPITKQTDPATYTPGGLPVYRSCATQWTAAAPVDSCANTATEKCTYSWTTAANVPEGTTCAPVAASSATAGNGIPWTVKNPVTCSQAVSFSGWVPKNDPDCLANPKPANTTCSAAWEALRSLPPAGDSFWDNTTYHNPWTDDNFNWAWATGYGTYYYASYGTTEIRFYRALLAGTTTFWAYAYTAPGVTPSTTKTTSIPSSANVTEAVPSPGNAGFCDAGDGAAGTQKASAPAYVGDKLIEVTCRKDAVAARSFATDACPGNQGTGAKLNEVISQLSIPPEIAPAKITCAVARSATTVNSNCGKQTDGTFLEELPATALNSWKRTVCTPGTGEPTPDTLADVAEYYFKTDLRTPDLGNCEGGPVQTAGGAPTHEEVCTNTGTAKDGQVMSTYTLGLGASGVMRFQEDYETAASGDFNSVWKGKSADPNLGLCSWQNYGTECNWPRPVTNSQTNIDDLWHAAVNGRGLYFSAENPSSMAAGISAALQNVTFKHGSLSAVTTSGSRLEAGSMAFQVSFTAGAWTGEVRQYSLAQDSDSGAFVLNEGWSAQAELDKLAYDTRTILTFDSGATDRLKPFDWDNLSDTQKNYFKKPHIDGLSQLCPTGTICLTPESRDDPNFGQKLVDFLRGDRGNEGDVSSLSKYFRKRNGMLGDIVGSEATYVKKPPRNYTDNGYSKFRDDTTASREGMIYVGANDGMLHAFRASSGQEAWAFVPEFLLPKLHRLADKNYSGLHQFFVDGTPVMGDICASNCAPGMGNPIWKTILVGGANHGGRGYYALDITDPANPKGLWEFTKDKNENLGYTYGNPVITKLANGTWVVLVTSGYNNTSPGDGKGHLFVLNANDGDLIRDISTGEGSTGTPSGLAKISTWVNYLDYNNTSLRVYGGDLLGNVWRFDINDNVGEEGYEAQRLATLKDENGQAQPISSSPELGVIKNHSVVFVGTGQLLGAADVSVESTQSLYALKDRLTDADYGNPRDQPAVFVSQEMTTGKLCPEENPYCPTGVPIVEVTKKDVDWAEQNGWYVDFPAAGERVNTSMRLMQGTLAITTNTPKTGACVPAGISYQYFLDYRTGGYVEGSDGMAGYHLSDNLSTSGTYVQIGDGTVHGLVEGDCSGKECIAQTDPPFEPPENKMRRISWRELITE